MEAELDSFSVIVFPQTLIISRSAALSNIIKPMKLLLLLILALSFTVCGAQTTAVGDVPLILEKFNLETPIGILYPARNKSRRYAESYEIRSKNSLLGAHYVVKETVYENEFDAQLKKPVAILYLQQSSSQGDRLAVFGKQFFNRFSLVAAPNGRIKLVGAAATNISRLESEAFIGYLTLRYGQPKKLKGDFVRVFDIYEWRAGDRTFRYAPIYADEKNVLKIKVDRANKTIAPAKKEPHLEGYFYVIGNEFTNSAPQIRTGDFVYLNED